MRAICEWVGSALSEFTRLFLTTYSVSVDFIFLCKLGKLGIVQNTDKILSMRKL